MSNPEALKHLQEVLNKLSTTARRTDADAMDIARVMKAAGDLIIVELEDGQEVT